MKFIARWTGVLAGCALLAACSVTPESFSSAAPSSAHFLVGAAAQNYTTFFSQTGVRPDVMEHYIHPFQPLPLVFAGPSVPLIQIEPRHAPLVEVTAGKYDAWFLELAKEAKAYHRPMYLGWAPEMNGPWYSWGYKTVSPAVYIAAWRHVVTIFRNAGVTNVTWIWTVNVTSAGVSDPAQWWPGANWAALTGIDGYFYNSNQTFSNVFGATLDSVKKFGPVLITETAASPAAGKAAKIPVIFAGARAAGAIGVIWFDLPGNRDWTLDDPSALAVFRAAVQSTRRKYA